MFVESFIISWWGVGSWRLNRVTERWRDRLKLQILRVLLLRISWCCQRGSHLLNERFGLRVHHIVLISHLPWLALAFCLDHSDIRVASIFRFFSLYLVSWAFIEIWLFKANLSKHLHGLSWACGSKPCFPSSRTAGL